MNCHVLILVGGLAGWATEAPPTRVPKPPPFPCLTIFVAFTHSRTKSLEEAERDVWLEAKHHRRHPRR